MKQFARRWIPFVLVLVLVVGCLTPVPSAAVSSTLDSGRYSISNRDSGRCLSAGSTGSIAELADGAIVAWGGNSHNELGGLPYSGTGTVVMHENKFQSAATGHLGSVFLKTDGTVMACGGPTNKTLHPIPELDGVQAVYSGYYGAYFALKTDGTLWSWSYSGDYYGALGQNGIKDGKLRQIAELANVKQADIQMGNALAVLEDGTVWGWGRNDTYQLAGAASEYSVYKPVKISNLENMVAVAAGNTFSMALKNDGSVWTWGSNERGQLGSDSKLSKSMIPVQVKGLRDVVAIDAGDGFGLALKSDGTVWSWGYNGSGQLGDGTTINRFSPVLVIGLDDATEISGGTHHALARRADGSIWGWGTGGGTLYTLLVDMGSHISRPIPIFEGGSSGGSQPPTGDMPDIQQLFTGENHTLALCMDGTLWAWGNNEQGQLGIGMTANQSSPVKIMGITPVRSVVAGLNHTFIFCEDGSIWTWGENDHGQLGVGNTEHQFIPVRLQ